MKRRVNEKIVSLFFKRRNYFEGKFFEKDNTTEKNFFITRIERARVCSWKIRDVDEKTSLLLLLE